MADNDTLILAAFDRWVASRSFIASSEDEDADAAHWEVVNEAEVVIFNTPATGAKAAEASLWLALDYMDDPIGPEVRSQNLDALIANEGLDWSTKLIVRGLANLRAMARGQ